MEEHDDWKLGDEAEPTTCPHCGKKNRAGLSYCAICGSALADDLEADPGSLRTLGEAMGGRRPPTRRAPRRHSLRAWTIAALGLLTAVVVLAWLQTREEPLLLEDLLPALQATATPAPPAVTATAVATRVIPPTRVARPPTPVPAAVPAPPPVVPTRTAEPPLPRPQPTRRPAAAAPEPPPAPRRTAAPRPVATDDPLEEPTPAFPRVAQTEKPSLGTDLQDATRRYRSAVDVHNARVDEYNALADEIQRRNAWDDSEASVELRRRLDRAREAVESARVEAEMLRTQMESVRGRYR